jgi:Spy/CpxP family protein refolding chaperone
MSVNRKIFTAMTLAIAVFALSTFVSAQDTTKSDAPTSPVKEGKMRKRGGKGMNREFRGEGMHGRQGGHSFMRSLRGIELTETQKTQIKSIMESNKTAFQGQHEQMKALMLKKREGSLNDADKAQLEQFKIERKAAAEQMKITVTALLTPEQTAKLAQMKAEREQRMLERKQRWEERKLKTEAPRENK